MFIIIYRVQLFKLDIKPICECCILLWINQYFKCESKPKSLVFDMEFSNVRQNRNLTRCVIL